MCITLCTIVAHNVAQNRPDNFPSYPPDRSEMHCTRLAANTGRKKVAKNRHLGTIAQLCRAIFSQLRHVSTIGNKLSSTNTSSTCPDNMVNFDPLTAEIGSGVWGTPANFNVFASWQRYCTHSKLGVIQTLRRWTEGATYIRQGGHHVGYGPTFLVICKIGHDNVISFDNNKIFRFSATVKLSVAI